MATSGKRGVGMSYLELRYAPRKCKHFCMGDCCIQYQENGDFKSCHTDYPDCKLAEPKEQTNE